MKKGYILTALTLAAVLGSTMTSFAGWQLDTDGYWWQNNDGTYPTNSWQWLDGNGDGVAECYYFGADGYMLANTTTPDGYTVNADGAWIELGIVRTKPTETPTPISTTEAKQNTDIPSGYNENGLSNIVIDMLEHTRAENAKYGESRVEIAGGNTYVFYENYGISAIYSGDDGFNTAYYGYEPTSNEKPSRVRDFGNNESTIVFKYAPMTGSVEQDYEQLKSSGFRVTTNGGSTSVDCGKYGVLIDNLKADAYIKFDYR